MANIKSQIKRNRQNEKRRIRNKAVRSELRTRVKAAEAGGEDAEEALKIAMKTIDKAAAKGIPEAQHNLGVMYANGQGVPKNLTEAANWSRKAADQGHTPAQLNVAIMYATGQGVAKDNAQAMNWLRKAAGQAGVDFDPSKVDIYMQGVAVCSGGVAADFSEAELKTRLNDRDCLIRFEIKGDGKGETRFWTCDFTEGYVKINASYRT